MLSHPNHYQIIDSFFDCYNLSYARSILSRAIKTAGTGKVWKGSCPANLLCFTERLQELIEAVFSLMEHYDYRPEVTIEEDDTNEYWLLQKYETWCGWHSGSTPWDFFPRHLSKKEFLDTYKALEKFTRYRSLTQWKASLKQILEHALSPNKIAEFDDDADIINTWIHLHKLIEATHLIELRSAGEKKQRHLLKWKDTKKKTKSATVKTNS